MLDGAVGIATRACQICLGRYGRGLSWLLLTTGGLVLPVCSSISLLLALLALLVQVTKCPHYVSCSGVDIISHTCSRPEGGVAS